MRSTSVIIAFFLSVVIYAQNNQQVHIYNDESIKLNKHVSTFITDEMLSGTAAYALMESSKLKQLRETQNPGMTLNKSYWIYFELFNHQPESDFILEVDYPQLDYLRLFEVGPLDSLLLIAETGDRFLFEDRPILYRNFAFPIALQEGKGKAFLLHIDKRSSAVRFPLTLYTKTAFWEMYNRDTIFYGFCFGVLSIIVIISLLTSVKLKMSIFMWYGLYVLTFGLRSFAKLGYGYQYLIPDFPELNTHFFPFTTQLSMGFLILYIQHYFHTKVYLPRFNQWMKVLVWMLLIFSVIWVAFPSFVVAQAPLLIPTRYAALLLIIAFAYTSALMHLKIDRFKAQVFLLGYSMFFLGIISQIMIEYGVIKDSFIPLDPLFLAFFIEIGVLSYAMIVYILNTFKEKQALAHSNKTLSKKVEELKAAQEETDSYLVLKSKAVIDTNHIKYIRADDHYVEFYLTQKKQP